MFIDSLFSDRRAIATRIMAEIRKRERERGDGSEVVETASFLVDESGQLSSSSTEEGVKVEEVAPLPT